MSDFVSDFWGYFVAAFSIVSIVACGVLLWAQGRVRVKPAPAPSEGEATGVATTGHVWDGDLTEYNNPLPRWWMWLFYGTIVFSLLYLVLYPGLGRAPGVLGWTSASAYADEQRDTEERLKPLYAKYLAMDLKAVALDADAHAMGERLFLNHCAQCHGSDARGGRGFPNLSHRNFMYGREPEQIKATITDGRLGVMPALGPALGEERVNEVVAYLRSLSNLPHDSLKAQLGKPVFAQTCAACHGAGAKGNQAIGAPDLTDDNWLYGSSETTIRETVRNGRHTQFEPGSLAMPSFKDTLGEGRIHVLAAYIWSLTGVRTASQ